MRKTKLLALLLVVAMIASMVVPSVAAEEPYTISIVDSTGASTINANAGDSVTLSLVIANNPGVSSIGIDIKRPEGWTTARPSNKNLFSDTAEAVATFSQTTGANPYYVSWLMATGTFENEDAGTVDMGLNKENGTLATVKITIPADAATGTYTIDLSIDGREKNNFYYNVDGNGVIVPDSGNTLLTPVLEDLTINVQGAEPAGEACPEHPETTTWTDVAAADWAAGGAIASGHYKLTEDIATTAALTVAEGETVCIDLAGHNITAGAKAAASTVSYRVFENAGTLAIVDTTATGEGDAYTAGIISGGAMKTQGNSTTSNSTGYGGNVLNTGTFTLVDGIIADGYLTGGAYDNGDNGANIYSNGGTLNIKGGWVKDGRLDRTSQTGTTQGGGNIYAKSTDVNITGGMITGGKIRFTDSSGNEKTYSSTTTADRKGYLNGGNLYVDGGSLDIANATIADGYIAQSYSNSEAHVVLTLLGGNIYVNNADTNITNSTITGGYLSATAVGGKLPASASLSKYVANAIAQGGNIYFKNSTKTLNIDKDTVISGGTAIASATKHASSTSTDTNLNTNYRGGNLYLESGIANIYGEISNGSGQRGSIFTPGNSTINVYDGAELYGSESVDDYGHEITVTGQSGILNIYGGTISSEKTPGATIYALYAPVNIYGGTIEHTAGGFAIMTYYSSNGNVVISQSAGSVLGKVKIDDNCEWNVTGGVIDGTITDNGTLSIGAGIIFYNEPSAYVANFEAFASTKDAEGADCYKTYGTLTEALTAAQAGDTVTLAKDVTADTVAVPVGVTLDLNGKNLTATEVTSAFTNAHIVDNIGTGKLTATSVSFAAANNQLPIYNDGAYTFEEVAIKEKYEEVGTKAIYKFYVNSEAAQTLLDDAILAGNNVAINVRVTWNDAAGNFNDKTVTLHADLLALYAGSWDTKMVILTINDISGVTNVDCTAQVVSNGVVEA